MTPLIAPIASCRLRAVAPLAGSRSHPSARRRVASTKRSDRKPKSAFISSGVEPTSPASEAGSEEGGRRRRRASSLAAASSVSCFENFIAESEERRTPYRLASSCMKVSILACPILSSPRSLAFATATPWSCTVTCHRSRSRFISVAHGMSSRGSSWASASSSGSSASFEPLSVPASFPRSVSTQKRMKRIAVADSCRVVKTPAYAAIIRASCWYAGCDIRSKKCARVSSEP